MIQPVMFLSLCIHSCSAYITSPNCCVEFWEAVQYPNKLIICVLEPLPADVMTYLKLLVRPEQIVDGIER
jgi:hypothetical protein